MPPLLLLQLAGRVLLSVSANAVQKRLLLESAPLRSTWIWTYALMLPAAALMAGLGPAAFGRTFWVEAATAGVLDALGNLAMIAALKSTDLSVFGPLNAFRPVLALLFAWLALGETPSTAGLGGIAVTVAGAVILLRDERETAGGAEARAGASQVQMLALRVAGLVLSTVAAVFLKRAATQGSAEMTLAAWTGSGLLCFLVFSLGPESRPKIMPAMARHRTWLIAHAAAFLVMQWLTILIFQSTLLAYSFVFFQFAIVLQVLVGWRVFREPAFRLRRLAGCAVMGIGTMLILWKG